MKLAGGIVLLVISVIPSASGSPPCPENCKKIPSLSTCTTDKGACSRGCVPGYYGNTCNMTCDVNCEQGICQRRDGSCSCKAGYTFHTGSCDSLTGVKCESNGNCLNDKCLSARRPDCLEGCKPGWFGKFCQRSCSSHCFCDEESGNCTNCVHGWYGVECESRCSPGCVDKECDRDGSCSTGCGKGFYGEKCESICPDQCYYDRCGKNGTCNTCRLGFYGAFCRQTCQRCTEKICEMITGECIIGCQRSYYGPGCSKECETCKDGVCNGRTGECVRGCVRGYYGSFCNLTCEQCKDGDCVRDTGECKYRDKIGEKWSAIGGSMAAVIIVLIAGGMFYISRRLKRVNGVVYDIVKWRKPSPSAVEDVRTVDALGYIELEEEASTNPPRVCPFHPARQTSYIEPQHSGGSGNNLQIQRQLQFPEVSDQQDDERQEAAAPTSDRLPHIVHRRPDDSAYRPDSYVLPSYSEVNEEQMAALPQPATPFSVVVDENTTQVDINIPLIAECFGPIETDDSSPDEETQPCVENYDNLSKDSNTHMSQATAFGYSQFDFETRIIQPMLHPMSTAKPANYIEPRLPGNTVQTQQRLLSARVSDNQEDEALSAAPPPSDRLLQEVPMATLPKPAQGVVMAAAVVNNSSLSDVADVHKTEEDFRIPLIAECFGPTEGGDSSTDEDSNQLVENYDHLFRDHYMEH